MPARHPHSDLPIDESIVLPAAVRAANERADALQQQINPTTPPPAPAPEAPQQQPAAPTASVPQAQELAPTPQPVSPAPLAPAPEAPPVEPPPPVPGSEDAKWEHQYRSMKGRYDAAAKMIDGLNQRIASLDGEIQTLRAAPPAPATPGVPEGLTEEDVNLFGPDMIALIDKVAAARVAKLGQRVDQVHDSVQVDARQRLFDELDKTFGPFAEGQPPIWRAINTDPQFLGWLNLPDLASGRIRSELLKEAFDANNTARVVHFFRSFISEAPPAPATEPAAPAPASAPPVQPPSNRIPLASLAAPGAARPAAPAQPGAPAEKRIWKTSEIARFYDDMRRGSYAGKEAQAELLEQDIYAAQLENRVTEG